MFLIHKSFVKSNLNIDLSKAFDTIYRSELFNIVAVFVIFALGIALTTIKLTDFGSIVES